MAIARKQSWESRLAARLVSRRLLSLFVVILLQILLIAALGALLWLTKVKDRVVAFADGQVNEPVAVYCKEGDRPQAWLVREGEAVEAGQPLARLESGQVLLAPAGGVVVGPAFDGEGKVSPGEPCLAILTSEDLRLQVRSTEIAKIAPKAVVRLYPSGAGAEIEAPLLGRVTEVSKDPPAVSVRLQRPGQGEEALAWRWLAQRLLAEGKAGEVLLEMRTRRLLTLLFRR